VTFEISGGDWREVSVNVPATGSLGVMRLYLPATSKPLELDWVEVTPKAAKPQRWDF
jgi:hypothetical protein